MKAFIYTKVIILILGLSALSACSNDDIYLSEEGKNVSVTFCPALDEVLNTRAIGDATKIDQLSVAVYEVSGNTHTHKFTNKQEWNKSSSNNVSLTLIEGRSYKILFWADNEANSAYTLTADGMISVDYTDYLNGGFSRMEEMDAFYGITEVIVGSMKIEDKGTIHLTRPFAQLNFADKTIQPTQGTHKAVVTFHSIPKSFNPFTGGIEMTDVNDTADDLTFVFTDFPTNENLTISQVPYYYVASNYLFVPASGTTSIEATLDLKLTDDTNINKFEFKGEKAIILEKNKKTNVLGNIVQQPVTWSVWDGTIPTNSTLEVDNQNRYIIDEALDIAWLSKKANTLEQNKTFVLTTDIDMNKKSGLSSIQLPQGSILEGGKHTIKGLSLDGGLLGNAVNVSVQDLTIEDAAISNSNTAVTHIGVLANTLAGSATFSNVTIKKSSVSTSNGAAGGMIGYVSRISKDSRTESLNVSFDNCHVIETSVEGSISEGHFVGLLRGYDNAEKLTFNDNCTLTSLQTATVANEFVSPYTEGNEGAWLATNDYSKFNGWLGNEECYRGTVMYGSNRFIPCWDGKTKVTPLTDGTTKLIYSAFDLANLQSTAAGNIKLMENVDMEHDLDGASKDGVRNHIFKALSTLTKLDGNEKTIYNITIRDNYYGGFVKSESCATTFENVTFDGADIRVTHDTSSGNGYVGTLRGFAWATTTINNVKVKNGYLYGVNKMGGLCGGVFSTLTCAESSVENYYIENYNSNIKDGGFYAHGECGGLIGMITSATAKISDCSVYQTTLHCMGQNDKWMIITIPGRHVNDFIGDIRLDGGQRVDLINNTVSNNKFTNRKKDTHSSKCPIVGKCYKISGTAGTVYIGSTKVF